MAKHRGGRATFPGRIPCPVCGGPIPELLSGLPWVQPAGPVLGPRLPGSRAPALTLESGAGYAQLFKIFSDNGFGYVTEVSRGQILYPNLSGL